ncbi:MAG: lysophospholipase [Ruminococcaceae bacterium]|nr:lysophospholipase [Oscillospiraceae bacterium]
MKRILFQGDSITDCGRDRENFYGLGCGYPNQLAERIGFLYPAEFEVVNRGISGNRVTDLLARWKCDCLNLKPDILSIMIGVNDVWHDFISEVPNGVNTPLYEKIYTILLEETLRVLPDVKIVLLEPYVLHGTATDELWDTFSSAVAEKREVVYKLAEKFNLPVVPLQKKLDEAYQNAPAGYWSQDGVHPTPAGHALIADAWLETAQALLK